MSTLINGRTPEEIKAAVLCTEKGTIPDCLNCTYCGELDENGFRAYQCHQANFDLIAYAEHLESERDAALAKVPKWISVKERLPEESGKYIVCTRKKAVYCTAFRFFHGKGYFATDSTTHITHWMPMPEPPKED